MGNACENKTIVVEQVTTMQKLYIACWPFLFEKQVTDRLPKIDKVLNIQFTIRLNEISHNINEWGGVIEGRTCLCFGTVCQCGIILFCYCRSFVNCGTK